MSCLFFESRWLALLFAIALCSTCHGQSWHSYPASGSQEVYPLPSPDVEHSVQDGVYLVSDTEVMPEAISPGYEDLTNTIVGLQAQVADLEASYDRLTNDSTLRPKWDERFEFKTYDGDFRLVIGARVENDYAAFDADDAIQTQFGPIDGGSEFRRARLVASAKLYDNMSFFSQYDFSTGRVRFASVYLGLSDIPYLHNIRIGQFEEPLGLERLTSHRFVTFMERGLTNAITPVRSTGIMFHDTCSERRGTWWIGYFRESNSVGFTQGDGADAITTRLTRLLTYKDDGRVLLHVGSAYSFRKPLEGTVRFRNRPESNLSTRFVDTGEFAADSVSLFSAEVAAVFGRLSVQSEYIYNNTQADSGESLDFSGYYAYLSFFLTGENRTYSRSSATFRRIRPHRNFDWRENCFLGCGAWELTARVSKIDLNSGSIAGGSETNGTFGVNWYWNPNMRTMFNYVLANRHDIGEANIFQTRLQLDF